MMVALQVDVSIGVNPPPHSSETEPAFLMSYFPVQEEEVRNYSEVVKLCTSYSPSAQEQRIQETGGSGQGKKVLKEEKVKKEQAIYLL